MDGVVKACFLAISAFFRLHFALQNVITHMLVGPCVFTVFLIALKAVSVFFGVC